MDVSSLKTDSMVAARTAAEEATDPIWRPLLYLREFSPPILTRGREEVRVQEAASAAAQVADEISRAELLLWPPPPASVFSGLAWIAFLASSEVGTEEAAAAAADGCFSDQIIHNSRPTC